MAGRRMFARSVTGSGTFMGLPAAAQALYFFLGMEADDDGFAEGKVVLRMTQRKEKDLRLLEKAGLVKVFGPMLITYIVDWALNNQIRKDRYHASRYARLLEEAEAKTAEEKLPEETGKDAPERGADREAAGQDRAASRPEPGCSGGKTGGYVLDMDYIRSGNRSRSVHPQNEKTPQKGDDPSTA